MEMDKTNSGSPNKSHFLYSSHSLSVELPELHLTSKPTTNEENYFRIYLSLKSQHTILQDLSKKLFKNEKNSNIIHPSSSFSLNKPPDIFFGQDSDASKILKDFLNSFLNCSYGELYILSAFTETILHPLLLSPNISPHVQKLGHDFLKSIFCIKRLMNNIQNEFHNNQDQTINSQQNYIPPISIKPIEVKDTIVCRICNEHVPIDLFEEHTKSCIEAYQTETKIQSIQSEMTYLQNKICEDHLSFNWPNEQNEAISTIIPLFRVSLLLERAYQIDCKEQNAANELFYISDILNQVNVQYVQTPYADVINRAKNIIMAKAQTSVVISQAAKILKNTRISGNADTQKIAKFNISDFDFIKRISAGAFARVFLAKMKISNDLYAIKVMPKDDIVQKNQVKRVVLEKDILLQFNNPYIINFYSSINGARNLYLVMEYLPGGDLYSLLHNLGSLNESVAKIYTYQIAVALAYLHSKGIIHRDIKPDNVLIAADGSLKLTDFGLSYVGIVDRKMSSKSDKSKLPKRIHLDANSTNNDEKLFKTRSMVGTPDYIAPEIIENKEHTSAVDWWSLGVVLYEFLVGAPPFHADTKEKTYENIKSCKYTLTPYVSEMLASIQQASQKEINRKSHSNDHKSLNETKHSNDHKSLNETTQLNEDKLINEKDDQNADKLSKQTQSNIKNDSHEEKDMDETELDFEEDEDPLSAEVLNLIKRLLTKDPTKRLGFTSSDEVLNHPWFSDIDPKHIPAPFIPELSSEQDTQYFETRYPFDKTDDSDILEDMEIARKFQQRHKKRSMTTLTEPSESSLLVPENNNKNIVFHYPRRRNTVTPSTARTPRKPLQSTTRRKDKTVYNSVSCDNFVQLPVDDSTAEDDGQPMDESNESKDTLLTFRHSISQVFFQNQLLSDNSSYSRVSFNVSSDQEGSNSVAGNDEDSEIASFPSMTLNNETLDEKFPSVSIYQLKNKNMQAFRRMSQLTKTQAASRSLVAVASDTSNHAFDFKKAGYSPRSNDDMLLPQRRRSLRDRDSNLWDSFEIDQKNVNHKKNFDKNDQQEEKK